MANFKVGDKVRIIDVGEIFFGDKHYYDGMVTEVVRIDRDGDVFLRNKEGDEGIYVGKGEYHSIELVKEDGKMKTEKRKARVGERILIVNEDLGRTYYANGDVLTVVKDYGKSGARDVVQAKGVRIGIYDYEYEVVIENTPDLTARVSELEAKVAELESELARKSQTIVQNVTVNSDPQSDMAKIAEAFRKLAGVSDGFSKTPNQRRADVIKQAREFVASQYKTHWNGSGDKVIGTGGILYTTEFIVNPEKRSVVVLMRGYKQSKVRRKGIAKCAPGDVFNADIGKAIALGRALDVKAPAEFLKAPQPTDAVDGQVITFPAYDGWHRKVNYRADGVGKQAYSLVVVRDDIGCEVGMRAYLGNGLGHLVIIDDTEAQY